MFLVPEDRGHGPSTLGYSRTHIDPLDPPPDDDVHRLGIVDFGHGLDAVQGLAVVEDGREDRLPLVRGGGAVARPKFRDVFMLHYSRTEMRPGG